MKVACPSKDQMIILEAQKGERLKQKKVVEEETIEETSILHSKMKNDILLDYENGIGLWMKMILDCGWR